MGLVIGLHQGDEFYVGDLRVTVTEILDPEKYKIMVHKSAFNEVHTVSASSRVEIITDVFVSAGKSRDIREVRAVLEAPRSIKILRGKLYDRSK